MNQTDDFLERIKNTETATITNLSRIFTSFEIESTSAYQGTRKKLLDRSRIEFKPDIYFRILTLCCITGLLAGTVYKILHSELKGTSLKVLTYVALLILITAIYNTIKDYFYNDSKNYKIELDKKGIQIGNFFFTWKSIDETAILTKYRVISQTKYLIIALDDMVTYEKFELTHFINRSSAGFSSTLSDNIEYFKAVTEH